MRQPPFRRLPGAALLLLLLLLAPPLHAEEGGASVEERLNQAKDLEKIQRDPEAALAIYQDLARRKDLRGEVKGQVLAGAARCHERVGSIDMAARYWDRIIADKELPATLRAWAQRKNTEKTRREQGTAAGNDDAALRERARLRAEQRRAAQEKVEEARKALQARRFDAAMHLCLLARELDPDNPAAQQLLGEIEVQRPDLGNVLGRLIEFVQTKELEEFEWLRAEVANIERAARRAFDVKDWPEADRLYRMAIALI
nr:hypothetical protein [Planctomycetota bacterium]